MITPAELTELIHQHDGVVTTYPTGAFAAVVGQVASRLTDTERDRVQLTSADGTVEVKARIGVYDDAESPSLLRSLGAAIKAAVLPSVAPGTRCTVILEIAAMRVR
ncbi:hypothetical protein GCM10027403_15360 [Arthrobacter tecti]